MRFDHAGVLVLEGSAKGLTCATFILAVFARVGINLVDHTLWPARQSDDREWLDSLERVMGPHQKPHLERLRQESDAGLVRIRPHEVVGACTLDYPASFEETAGAGKLVLAKLDGTTAMFRPGARGLYEPGQPDVVVAVDLGFSKSKKSCGLAMRRGTELSAVEVAFGPCIKRVAEELGGATNPVLIIEAPLSGFFGATGNPSHRDEIEIETDANGQKQHRGWYYGAGAAICLGAIAFLRSLGDELGKQAPPPTVTVYEGFVSFKSETTSHSDDASTLRQAFDEGHILELKVPDRVTVLSVLNLISDASSGLPPAIVQVPRK